MQTSFLISLLALAFVAVLARPHDGYHCVTHTNGTGATCKETGALLVRGDLPEGITERGITRCFDEGTTAIREDMIRAINRFCTRYMNRTWDATGGHDLELQSSSGADCEVEDECFSTIVSKITVKRGHKYTILDDGSDPRKPCGYYFRRIVDQCDTESTQNKQGGWLELNSVNYYIDPTMMQA